MMNIRKNHINVNFQQVVRLPNVETREPDFRPLELPHDMRPFPISLGLHLHVEE